MHHKQRQIACMWSYRRPLRLRLRRLQQPSTLRSTNCRCSLTPGAAARCAKSADLLYHILRQDRDLLCWITDSGFEPLGKLLQIAHSDDA